jgi:hypothetical protein
VRWVRHVKLHGTTQKASCVSGSRKQSGPRIMAHIGGGVKLGAGPAAAICSVHHPKPSPLQTRTFGADGSYLREASSVSEGRRRNAVAAEPRSSLCDMAGRRKLITLANAELGMPPDCLTEVTGGITKSGRMSGGERNVAIQPETNGFACATEAAVRSSLSLLPRTQRCLGVRGPVNK